MNGEEIRDWAEETFGHAELGDSRRTRRLVHLAAEAARHPAGKVLEVCKTGASRQGAYDFLNNQGVAPEAIQSAVTIATARACNGEPFCFVVIDGTSLTLADWRRTKDFGAVGSTSNGARGLKVMNAYAIAADGSPIGLLGQKWWRREARAKRSDCNERTVEEKETRYWRSAIQGSELCLSATGTRAWFLLDREGDRYATLKTLDESGQWFTVRSTYAHRFLLGQPRTRRLRHAVSSSTVRGWFKVDVPAKSNRPGRRALMAVRTTSVVLDMVEPSTGETYALPVNVVDAKEVGRVPANGQPIHWRLLTNRSVTTEADVDAVLLGYAQRWKIEELHRTWKSGACRVEESQLRTTNGVMKWAIIMAATATRIERLKHLHRTVPTADAADEFSRWEIGAAVLMKRKYLKKGEVPPPSHPSLGQVILWLSEFGGYTGKSSGGPPGSITIRRGLDFIAPVALALQQLEEDGRM